MGDAKRLIVKPISSQDANRIIKGLHYSGKVVNNSQVHLGVFLDGRCGGAMQFGVSTDIRKTKGLVSGTEWHGFKELNRMAFADWLPPMGESRCIAYAMRWIKKAYPHIQWIISFADGTQCGDGTIYRATGFVLTAIKKNTSLLLMPGGEIVSDKSLNNPNHRGPKGEMGSSIAKAAGAKALPGFQLRYIYFIDPTARERLTVPEIPFSEIQRRGAGMYLGKPSVRSVDSDTSANHAEEGGATPTRTLLSSEGDQ